MSRCSRVCGMTESSDATARRTRSTPCAPATIVRTNFSCPGTSTNENVVSSHAACAKPRSIVIPRAFSSGRRSGSVPVSALTSALLPWSMWPAVPTRTRRMGADYRLGRIPHVPAAWKGADDRGTCGPPPPRADAPPRGGRDRTTGSAPVVGDVRRARAHGRSAHPAAIPAAPAGHVRHGAAGRVRFGDDLGLAGSPPPPRTRRRGATKGSRETVVSTAENFADGPPPLAHLARDVRERARAGALRGRRRSRTASARRWRPAGPPRARPGGRGRPA